MKKLELIVLGIKFILDIQENDIGYVAQVTSEIFEQITKVKTVESEHHFIMVNLSTNEVYGNICGPGKIKKIVLNNPVFTII